jgi:hypothetical protein
LLAEESPSTRADRLYAAARVATFVNHVVPILQRRGRFRTGYTGTTLHSHLGLSRPHA